MPGNPFQFVQNPHRLVLDADASLVRYITKSLESSAKSIQCSSSDFSSVLDPATRFLFILKLEQFDCFRRLVTWLSDYFINKIPCTNLDRKIPKPPMNCSGIFQKAAIFHWFQHTLPVYPPASLVHYSSTLMALLFVTVYLKHITSPTILATTLSPRIYLSLVVYILICLVAEDLSAFCRPAYPADCSFTYIKLLTRVDSGEYLEISIDITWSGHLFQFLPVVFAGLVNRNFKIYF